MGNSFLLVAGANLAACVYVGYLAQAERGHAGAPWGLVMFAFALLWHATVAYVGWWQDLEYRVHQRPASLIDEDAFTAAHVMGLFVLAQVMALLVWTLPNRKGA